MHYVKIMVFAFLLMMLAISPGMGAQEQENVSEQITVTEDTLDHLQEEGQEAFYSADYLTALEKWQTGLNQAQTSGNEWYISKFLNSIGVVYRRLGQYQKALEYYEQALVITYELDDKYEQGDILTNIGVAYWSLEQYHQALDHWMQALIIHRELDEKHGQCSDLSNIGLAYTELGQYWQALEYYEQALVIAREINDKRVEGNTLNNMSVVYQYVGKYRQALEYSEQALATAHELDDTHVEAANFINIGNIYQYLGQYQNALEYYEQALAMARTIGEKEREGSILNNIGVIYYNLGRYDQALEYYQKALTINQQIHNKTVEANTIINMGVVYAELGQYQKELDYYEQAFVIFHENDNLRGKILALENIATSYLDFGSYYQALDYYEQALTIAKMIDDKLGEGSILSDIGVVYHHLGQYQEALKHYEQALMITREIGNNSLEGSILNSLGWLYLDSGEDQKAHMTFQNNSHIVETLGETDGLWRAQRGLAATEVRLNQFESAIIHYKHAIENIELLRTEWTEKEHKVFFMQDKFQVYDELIDVLHNLHRTHPNKNYDRKALETFERRQGRVFLEEMGQSGARLFAGIPESILQKETTLENQIEQTRKQLVEERSKPITEQNRERIQNLEQREKSLLSEQQTLKEKIKTEYPDYHVLRYPRPAGLTDLQQNVLQSDEFLLVYSVMQDQAVLWVVSKQDLNFITLDIREEDLQKEIEAFRAAPNAIIEAVGSGQSLKAIRLADDTLDDMAQAGYGLYQRLFPGSIRPLVAQTQAMYIIPTGPLYGLPFEALVTETPKEDEVPHYLLQDHSITYLSSASLLKILRDAQARRKQTTIYPLLAFADPEYPETCQKETPSNPPLQKGEGEFAHSIQTIRTDVYLKSLGKKTCFSKGDELPDTANEVKAIAAILEAPEESEPLQLREQASRSTVFRFNEQEQLDDYRYLLFSAHAILPGEVDRVNQSAIVLSHPEKEGYLTMADVFSLQFNADLVVLSACNTGQGQQIRGEGILGLTRAFMYAGTPAVAVTLWSVDAKASREINTRFFRQLKAGKPLAAALRQAKLDLLASAKEDEDLEYFRHPFFWAPFLIFGDGRGRY